MGYGTATGRGGTTGHLYSPSEDCLRKTPGKGDDLIRRGLWVNRFGEWEVRNGSSSRRLSGVPLGLTVEGGRTRGEGGDETGEGYDQ